MQREAQQAVVCGCLECGWLQNNSVLGDQAASLLWIPVAEGIVQSLINYFVKSGRYQCSAVLESSSSRQLVGPRGCWTYVGLCPT